MFSILITFKDMQQIDIWIKRIYFYSEIIFMMQVIYFPSSLKVCNCIWINPQDLNICSQTINNYLFPLKYIFDNTQTSKMQMFK